MKLRRLDADHCVFGALLGLAVLLLATQALRLEGNVSPSMPRGLYWRVADRPVVRRGMLVRLSPPDAGVEPLLHEGGRMLLKRVVGVSGDTVCWDAETMAVNGVVLAYRQAASPVKTAPVGCQTLGASAIVVLAEHAQSVDSRDFGPVHVGRVLAEVVPLWTWR